MKREIWMTSAMLAFGAMSAPALAFDPIVVIDGQARVIHPGGGTQEVLATRAGTDGKFGATTTSDPANSGPGSSIVHANEVEIWYVLEGQYTFYVGGKTYEGGPGTFVAVDAGQPHEYVTKTPGKLLMMWSPGGFEQFFMDWDKQGLKPGPDLGKLEASYGVTRP